MATTTAIDKMIARAERRLAAIRQIRELIDDDLDILDELRRAITANGELPSASMSRQVQPPVQSNLDCVRRLFESRANQWLTAPEIIQATKLPRGTLATIMHGAHGEKFEKRDHPRSRKLKQWRLREVHDAKES